MNKVEKNQASETSWDHFIRDKLEIKSPKWHQNILAKRKIQIDEGTAQFRPIAELRPRQPK
jgi:hypothetical protein